LLVILFFAVVCAASAFYQSYFDENWGLLRSQVADIYRGRASGFFGQPNAFAGFMSLMLPIPLFYAFSSKRSLAVQVACVVVYLFLQWALFLSISRGAMIALIPMLCVMSILLAKPWKKKMLVLLILLGAYAAEYKLITITNPQSVSRVEQLRAGGGEVTRKVYFPAAVSIWQENPLCGSGEGSFRLHWDRTGKVSLLGGEIHAHSDVLENLAETGLIGFLLYYGAVLLLMYGGLKSLRREEAKDSVFVRIALVGLTGFLIHGGVDFLTKYQSLSFMSYIYLAFLAQVVVQRWGVDGKMAKLIIGGLGCFFVAILAMGLPYMRAYKIHTEADGIHQEVVDKLNGGQWAEKEELNRSLGLYIEALEVEPSYEPSMMSISKLLTIYTLYYPSRKAAFLDDALTFNDASFEVTSESWMAWAVRGKILDSYGDRREEAEAAYQSALKMAPSNLRMRLLYIDHLLLLKDDYEMALTEIQELKEMFPGVQVIQERELSIKGLMKTRNEEGEE